MNVLIIGSGGREHALAWKIRKSPLLKELYLAPGNAGTARLGENIHLSVSDFTGIRQLVLEKNINMVVVGPEVPLVEGIHDFFLADPLLKDIPVIGPIQRAAMLEGSKDFAKAFLERHHIPTARYRTFQKGQQQEAIKFLLEMKPPYVLKADGLAAGKGVVICQDLQEAQEVINAMLVDAKFGQAGEKVIIEEFLSGIEMSAFILTDGLHYLLLPSAKDYKKIGEGDTGPNTGGMGSVSPVPFADDLFMKKVKERIIAPTHQGLIEEGIEYKGFIFFGLINVDGEPFVIEYNARMGDPEAESVIPRIKNDLLELFIAVGNQSLDQKKIETDPRYTATVMLVSEGYPGSYEKNKPISGLDAVQDSLVFHAGTTFSSDKSLVMSNGGRVLAITSFGDSMEEAFATSYVNSDKIHFENKAFRKDLGKDLIKYLLTFLIVFLALHSSGQDYKLFDADSKKLYTTYPVPGLTSGIDFDSVIMAGDYSIYLNYTGIGNEFESDTCIFWGGSTCLHQDKPLWLGYSPTVDFMGTYHFKTCQDNFLSFDFNLLPGDSSIFYQDASQSFYMVYEGADTATILDFQDSARFYRIAHYDLSGNIINSALNNEKIIIGREMGLAGFFRVDSFPMVLQPISLIGNTYPPAGILSLTHEMIYDHQAGDVIQYLDHYYYPDGPPAYNYTNYIKHYFLDRTDTQDSIFYSVERTTYKTDSNLVLMDTIMLKYRRSATIAGIPFNKLNQDVSLVLTDFYHADYCELKLWTYSLEPQYLVYCPEDNCWGSYDIPGPPPDEETIYVCGLGKYLDKSSLSAPPPQGYYHIYNIIYFKKDGIECGEEVIVNIENPFIQAHGFNIYPNPATDKLHVKIEKNARGTLAIFDLTGRQLKKIYIDGQSGDIDIEGLNNGVYLVEFISESFTGVSKIIIRGR
jgi:phosphoribosylamine--glycine ligase